MKMKFNQRLKIIFGYILIFKLTTVKLSILKTDNLPNQCVVHINNEDILKSVGESWKADDPCIQYTCELDTNGTPYSNSTTEYCISECKIGYELQPPKSDECCGKCIETSCEYEKKLYSIGTKWRSQDNCMLFECAKEDDSVTTFVYFQRCPLIENCLPENIYIDGCCRKCRKSKNEDELDNTDFLNENTYKNHPCKRDCIENTSPMICEYTFMVEWYETLSKACYDCPLNLTDCNRPHCIVGDGTRRSVLVVNRMMPGPVIDVCLNDTIVVDVKNRLLGESTTIHWHGLHQRETPYMDGVPHISQCPIAPHTTFRYNFKASHPGTHFWHSHTGMQRGDGSFGALIIRKPKTLDTHSKLYDYDIDDHIMIVQDWGHIPGVSMFSSHHHSIGDNKPPNILINGKGQYYIEKEIKMTTEKLPSTTTEAATTTLEYTSEIFDEITTEINLPENIDYIQSDVNVNMKMENTTVTHDNIRKRSTDIDMKLIPLETFNVAQGFRYRFRIINAEFLNCPVSISIDNHTLLVINSDGYDLEPINVTSLVTYAGERFDFILNANQKVDNYWIRIKGLMDCDERFTKAHQIAILKYDGAGNEKPLGTAPTYDYSVDGLELNSLNKGPGQHINTLTIAETKSSIVNDNDPNDWFTSQQEPDYKFYIFYDFYPKDNPHFHIPKLYGFNQITNSNNNKLFTPQLNHISLKMPSMPLMPARDQIDTTTFCNETSLAEKGIDCRKEFCECSHVLQIRLDSIVEMILIDEGVTYDANHPFHLHGNAFRVVGMDRIARNITVEQVKEMDKAGLLKRNLKQAPIKDTVTVPDGGYTIIRFKADNPGYWLFHCHIEFHAEIGMAVVLKVGEHNEMIPVPKNFPTCSDYIPKIFPNDGSGAAVRIISSLFISLLVIINCILL